MCRNPVAVQAGGNRCKTPPSSANSRNICRTVSSSLSAPEHETTFSLTSIFHSPGLSICFGFPSCIQQHPSQSINRLTSGFVSETDETAKSCGHFHDSSRLYSPAIVRFRAFIIRSGMLLSFDKGLCNNSERARPMICRGTRSVPPRPSPEIFPIG